MFRFDRILSHSLISWQSKPCNLRLYFSWIFLFDHLLGIPVKRCNLFTLSSCYVKIFLQVSYHFTFTQTVAVVSVYLFEYFCFCDFFRFLNFSFGYFTCQNFLVESSKSLNDPRLLFKEETTWICSVLKLPRSSFSLCYILRLVR